MLILAPSLPENRKNDTPTQNKLSISGWPIGKVLRAIKSDIYLKSHYAENDDAQQTINVISNVYMENARNEIIETA